MRCYQVVMNYTTIAIFENGLLRPMAPLDLPEHTEVEITVQINDNSLHSKVRKALNLQVQSNKIEDVISNKRRAELSKSFTAENL